MKKRKGPVPHEPTEETKTLVQNCVLAGCTQEMIAQIVGISKSSLKTHYKEVLASSVSRANGRVAATALSMALSGRHPAMTIFWLKTKAGWRETDNLEHTGSIKVVFDDVSQSGNADD